MAAREWIATPAVVITAPARSTRPAASRNRARSMARIAPRVKTAAVAGIKPAAAFPRDMRPAIRIVASTSDAGTAAAARSAARVAMTVPARGASPRRISRPRSRSRPRACRLLTVPIGQPRPRAASSWLRPSRSQSTIALRNPSGSRPTSSCSAAICSSSNPSRDSGNDDAISARLRSTDRRSADETRRAGGDAQRDRVQPRPERIPHPERTRLVHQHQEGRLEGVLGIVLVAEGCPAGVQHHRPVPRDQRRERQFRRLARPAGEPLEQLAVSQLRGDPLGEDRAEVACGGVILFDRHRVGPRIGLAYGTIIMRRADPVVPDFLPKKRKTAGGYNAWIAPNPFRSWTRARFLSVRPLNPVPLGGSARRLGDGGLTSGSRLVAWPPRHPSDLKDAGPGDALIVARHRGHAADMAAQDHSVVR